MDIFAISDLHLGPGQDKGHYSSKWKEHQTAIRKHWDERIPNDALVLMPGDFSWFQDPGDLIYDYYWIHDRPGQKKILSPGNHDYGVWTSQKQVRDFCQRYDSLVPLMGDALRIPNPYGEDKPGIVIAAACGTQSPEDKYFDSNSGASSKHQDPEAKRFVRELARLRAALHSAKIMQQKNDHLIVMIHYPPFANGSSSGPFSDLIEEAGAELCVYGHLHQEGQWLSTFQGAHGDCEYRFVGTDFLGFAPTRMGSFDEEGLHLDAIERRAELQWKTKENTTTTTTSYGNTHSNHSKATTPATATKPSPPSTGLGNQGNRTPASGREVPLNGFGKERVCVECSMHIYDGEAHHYTPEGPVHGVGTYAEQWTCPAIRTKGHTINGSVTPIICAACELPILNREPTHKIAKGDIHGKGSYNDEDTCLYADDDEAARTRTVKKNPQQKSADKYAAAETHQADDAEAMQSLFHDLARDFAEGRIDEQTLDEQIEEAVALQESIAAVGNDMGKAIGEVVTKGFASDGKMPPIRTLS